MPKSDWISGEDLKKKFDLTGRELLDLVIEGVLTPYDGDAELPAENPLIADAKQHWAEKNKELEDYIKEKSPYDPILKTHPYSDKEVKKRQKDIDLFVKSVQEIEGWSFKGHIGGKALQDNSMVSKAVAVCNKSIYRKHDVNNIQTNTGNKENGLRPDQKAKEAVRAIAEEKWRDNPDMTKAAMVTDHDIIRAAGEYKPKTRERWIADLNPNRKPGRRKP